MGYLEILPTKLTRRIAFEPNSGCWLWLGTMSTDRYGIVRIKGKQIYLHRVVYSIVHNIQLQTSDVIRHKCDTPLCCNPNHLLLGTHLDNARDRDERGRGRWHAGEEHWRTVLTAEEVNEIRVMARDGLSYREISKYFIVGENLIGKIVRGERWRSTIQK